MNAEEFFKKKMMGWHIENRRDLPWKKTKDPYKIWLSEVILQQTRVEQGIPYYLKLVQMFPDVGKLALCKEDDLLKAWQGLGYYSRARNLHATAKQIVSEWGGRFPDRHDEILKLKGVGPYSAAAIASFAFDLPHAVVDGNVYRVLSRFYGVEDATDSTLGKKKFAALAQTLLDKKNPGAYNQAIMDFGSLVCKPAQPLCAECALQSGCIAFKKKKVTTLPFKNKITKLDNRWFYYLVIRYSGKIALQKRAGDIWKGLYQFPVIERKRKISRKELLQTIRKVKGNSGNLFIIKSISAEQIQQLSHRRVIARFIEMEVKKAERWPADWQWIPAKKVKNYAFPKILADYLKMFLP